MAGNFVFGKYIKTIFQGIILNTSFIKVLTVRKSQFTAL